MSPLKLRKPGWLPGSFVLSGSVLNGEPATLANGYEPYVEELHGWKPETESPSDEDLGPDNVEET